MLRAYASSTFGHMALCCLPLLDVTETWRRMNTGFPVSDHNISINMYHSSCGKCFCLVMGTPDQMFK